MSTVQRPSPTPPTPKFLILHPKKVRMDISMLLLYYKTVSLEQLPFLHPITSYSLFSHVPVYMLPFRFSSFHAASSNTG
jgi:hypothetical protein